MLVTIVFSSESTDVYLHFLNMDTIHGVSEVEAARSDDGYTGPVSVDGNFPFGDSTQSQFYVSYLNIIIKRIFKSNLLFRLARME